MRISKSIIVVLFVSVWILGLVVMNAFALTPGVSHPASEILGGADASESDAYFLDPWYKFNDYLEAGGQITAGTKFYVGGAEFTSQGIGQIGASNFAIKTSNTDRVTVTSGGYVGIGITNPDAKLHVNAAPKLENVPAMIIEEGDYLEIRDTSAEILFNDSNDNRDWRIGGTDGYFDFETRDESVSPTTYTSKVRILFNGNVGIGTVSPSYQLSIADTSANQAGFLMSPTAPPGLSGFLALYGSGKTPGVDKPNLVIAPQSYSTCPGCIGVNKTQPVGGSSPISTTLDVEGTVTATAFLGDGSGLTGIGSGTGGVINTGSTTIGADSDSDGVGQIDLQTRGNTRMMIKSNGMMGIVPDPTRPFNDPTRTLCIGSQTTCIDNGYNPAVGSPIWPTDLQLDTLAFLTNNTERMRITSTGLIGIGTSSPTTNLHLRSTGSIGLLLEADTDNITETDQPVITFSQDGGIVTGQLGYLNGTNALTLKNIYNDTLYLGTNNTNRITILGNGNVGIGMSPTYRLDVSGDIRASGTIYGTLVGTASNLECSPAGCVGTNDIADGAVTNAKISAMDWVKLQNYPAACPAGQAVSQLGDTITCITVNPTGTLTGSGSANTVAKFTGTYTLGDSIISDNGSSVSIGGNLTASGVGTFNGAGDNYFAGNVGIGIVPTYKLHVSGNVYATGNIESTNQITAGTRVQVGASYLESATGYIAGNLTVTGITSPCADVETNASGQLICGTDAVGVTGSGTAGRIAKWTGGTSLGDSIMNESGSGLYVSGGMQLDSGIRINSTGGAGKPACDATLRGTLWFTQGGAGVKDTLEVCAKDATDAYAWRLVW